MVKILRALWHYRQFIWGLVVKDFKSRYLNSIFGSIWSILNPLSQILIYTLVFSQVMKAKLPGIEDTLAYSIYLCSGIISWQFFSEVLMRCSNIFIEQGNLLKKVDFPKSSLPLYVLLSSGINYIIIFVIFLLFLLITGRFPDLTLIAVIPLLILQMSLAVGLGIFLGTLNVFFRDVTHFMGIVLQFWFWLTPMVYPYQIVPETFQIILQFNPLTAVVQGYQDIFLYNFWPIWSDLIYIAVVSATFLLFGYFTFVKLNAEMVDEL